MSNVTQQNAPKTITVPRDDAPVDLQLKPFTQGTLMDPDNIERSSVRGLVLRKKRGTDTVTGFQVEPKREWVAKKMKQASTPEGQKMLGLDKAPTRSYWERAYDKYRVETYRAASVLVGNRLISGQSSIDALAVDPKTGLIKTARFVKPVEEAKNAAENAAEQYAAKTGIPPEEVIAALRALEEQHKQKGNGGGATDVQATEVPALNVPQHVPAGQ